MPLVWISLAFLGGIAAAGRLTPPAWVWPGLSALLLILLILTQRLASGRAALMTLPHPPFTFLAARASAPFVLALLLAAGLGAWRWQAAQPRIDAFHIAFYNDRDYELLVSGSVAGFPDVRDTYTNLRIEAQAVDSGSGDLPVSGQLLVRVPANQRYEYGQRLRLRGRLETPPEEEDFSYRDYLARQGIHSMMGNAEVTVLPGSDAGPYRAAAYGFKERLLGLIHRLFHDPEASLLAGILLGVDTGLARSLQDAFKNTGTAHIIAISGFNIAIIAGALFSIFRTLFGEWRGAVLAVLGIFLYAFLVGGDAAVMRAAFMGTLSLTARQFGRRSMGLNALMLAALIMALLDPFILGDAGFQLSFSATLGLVLYAEPFSNATAAVLRRFIPEPGALVRILNENVVLTFAAQLTTLPIMAYHFNRISLVSLLANPFILPVQPAVMILPGLALLTGLAVYPLGQLLAWVAWPFAAYTIRMVELFDRVPHGVIHLGDFSAGYAALFYAVLLGLTFGWPRIREWASAMGSRLQAAALTAALAFLFVCTLLVWRSTAGMGDGRMHLLILDAGSADALLIQTPEGRNVLINGGPSAAQLSDALGRRLPFFMRRLDWLVVASTAEDDLAALPRVMQRYPPQQVLWSGNVQASFAAGALDRFLAAEGIPVQRAEAGQRLRLGGDAFLEVLAEGPRGSLLLLEYGNFRALLPVGVSEGAYESIEYGNAVGPVDLLLLADSGYAPSNPPDLAENLRPALVVLSVAAGDPDGLPSPEVLEALAGYSLLRTDRSGWISVTTDGDEMRVTVERAE